MDTMLVGIENKKGASNKDLWKGVRNGAILHLNNRGLLGKEPSLVYSRVSPTHKVLDDIQTTPTFESRYPIVRG
jgi:hypothetical protein